MYKKISLLIFLSLPVCAAETFEQRSVRQESMKSCREELRPALFMSLLEGSHTDERYISHFQLCVSERSHAIRKVLGLNQQEAKPVDRKKIVTIIQDVERKAANSVMPK